jgi:hypothetical protein
MIHEIYLKLTTTMSTHAYLVGEEGRGEHTRVGFAWINDDRRFSMDCEYILD